MLPAPIRTQLLPQIGFVLVLVIAAGCAPSRNEILDANAILPSPPPRTAIGRWTATATRETLTVTVSGATLRGWRFHAPASATQRLGVLFFNGNAMTVADSESLYRELALQGADITVFDYRGYGFSTGTPDVMAFRRDALALYDQVAASGPLVVYGFSMGTAVACYLASQRKVAGLVLAGAIASAQEEFPVYTRAQGFSAATIAHLEPAPNAVEAFNERRLIAQSTAPLLVLHGQADTLVPIAQGREVFAASPVREKLFVSVDGAAHNRTVGDPLALHALRSFLISLAAARRHARGNPALGAAIL